ncbi:MAG: hypothetical protein IIY72_09260 [Solobacterium sp.]|nr:hypothetical protein [Solobacterium sp.]MBQ1356656.1 hypothetical protein [Solobacterium sp.]
MKKAEPREKDAALAARQQAEERDIMRQRRIRNRKLLETEEPVVFEVLSRACAGELAHAYLLSGPRNALKSDAAVLLAASILLHADHLIDEEALPREEQVTAERVATRNHADLLVLDGYRKEMISLEKVQAVSSLFSRTAAETGGRKVYIILHAENMSIGAMNGLLKFLEEPAPDVYAILTTDNIERLLPTVISRCVGIPFHSLSPAVYEAAAAQEGLDPEDAYLMSHLVYSLDGLADMAAGEAWQKTRQMLKQFLGAEGDPRMVLTDYDLRIRSTDKDVNLDILTWFFGALVQYYRDVITGHEAGPDWYRQAMNRDRKTDPARLAARMRIAAEQRDRCNRNNDLNLVLAQAMYRWEVTEE